MFNNKKLDEWNPLISDINKITEIKEHVGRINDVNLLQDLGGKLIATMQMATHIDCSSEEYEDLLQLLAISLGELKEFCFKNCIAFSICQHDKSIFNNSDVE